MRIGRPYFQSPIAGELFRRAHSADGPSWKSGMPRKAGRTCLDGKLIDRPRQSCGSYADGPSAPAAGYAIPGRPRYVHIAWSWNARRDHIRKSAASRAVKSSSNVKNIHTLIDHEANLRMFPDQFGQAAHPPCTLLSGLFRFAEPRLHTASSAPPPAYTGM